MGKIKVCLDDACSKYYLTDDHKMIITPRETCAPDAIRKGKNPKSLSEFKTLFNQMTSSAKRTLYVSSDPGWKEGDEAAL